ncbi:hypothetical protein ACFPTO_18680 [Paraburkholderia denitrificans]|uniref:Uncharacterized protein n=1 Tax=Paraburkholderia denitrificans TaxID=694025 RepID=A0ABW0JCU3_9BURK
MMIHGAAAFIETPFRAARIANGSRIRQRIRQRIRAGGFAGNDPLRYRKRYRQTDHSTPDYE